MRIIELNRASLDKYIRSVGVRQIRLACGLVLFAYLLSHFINHALGNISLDALATGVRYHTAFWKSLPITTVFYAAAAAHAGLGLWALYQRRQFHWKAIEPIQLVLGLSIPALIITPLPVCGSTTYCFNIKSSTRRCFTRTGLYGHTRCG